MTASALRAPARGRLLAPFPERDVRPGGWVADQLRADLRAGVVGHLDRLAPDLLVHDEIFGRDRLRPGAPPKDLGALSEDTAWVAQFGWWNAETQGNWRDGWIHHALWAGDASDAAAARAWVDGILATQDADGYLGIHAPALRWPERGEHGELWAQAVLVRALLGYHGHTGDEAVLAAVRRALDRTMAGYPAGRSAPFGREASFGGVTHGLMLVDGLWELARLTGDDRYLAYAGWLYRSFAASPHAEGDAQAAALLDPAASLRGHGVHTYEHWRALTVAAVDAAERDDPAPDGLPMGALEAAYADRLEAALTPAGAPNGDEFCHAAGSADDTGYELCSVQELLHAYGRRVEATGELALGDRMESLVLNVAFGMRDPLGPGVAYLRTDNSRSLAGAEGFRPPDPRATVAQTRYRFSPLHREAAVCCVPNWGRILPTYARYQWLLGRANGRSQIVALLFGASELRTATDGVPVTITQLTGYPAETTVRFVVETAAPASFSLAIRVPGWTQGLQVAGVAAGRVHRSPSLVRIDGPWTGRTTVEAWFAAPIEVRAVDGGRVVGRGPLLFALPLPADRETARTYDVPGVDATFADVLLRPRDPGPDPVLPADPRPRPAPVPPWTEAARAPHAWQRTAVAADLRDRRGRTREYELVPMGATGLRVAVFPPG